MMSSQSKLNRLIYEHFLKDAILPGPKRQEIEKLIAEIEQESWVPCLKTRTEEFFDETRLSNTKYEPTT